MLCSMYHIGVMLGYGICPPTSGCRFILAPFRVGPSAPDASQSQAKPGMLNKLKAHVSKIGSPKTVYVYVEIPELETVYI